MRLTAYAEAKGLRNGLIRDEKVVIPWPDTLDARRIPGAELTGLDHGIDHEL